MLRRRRELGLRLGEGKTKRESVILTVKQRCKDGKGPSMAKLTAARTRSLSGMGEGVTEQSSSKIH